jgi:hypothetical protein
MIGQDSKKIWDFIETSEPLHIVLLETRKTHKLFLIMFKLLTVGTHFFSKMVKFSYYNQEDKKKELWFKIMDELMSKFKGINISDELTEDDIADLMKHVLDNDSFPDILIDSRKGDLTAQPILTLIATKMSPKIS